MKDASTRSKTRDVTTVNAAYSYDFTRLITNKDELRDLELSTEFRYNSTDDLDRILFAAKRLASNENWSDDQIRLLGTFSVFGREYDGFTVFITGQTPDDIPTRGSFLTRFAECFDTVAQQLGFLWRYFGFVSFLDVECPEGKAETDGVLIYSQRADKKENAPAYLQRVYAAELAEGQITLGDLRDRDKSLWVGLRNWANAGKRNLETLIPRGKINLGGRPSSTPEIDPAELNPDDPRDALALQALRHRMSARESARRKRARAATAPKLG